MISFIIDVLAIIGIIFIIFCGWIIFEYIKIRLNERNSPEKGKKEH